MFKDKTNLDSSSPHTCNVYSIKKVVGISTVSRKEHASAQTREVQCTKLVLPEVIQRGTLSPLCIYNSLGNNLHVHIIILFTGLKVVEVAHDYQAQVQKYVVDELNLTNSYDTWHGKTKQCTILH